MDPKYDQKILKWNILNIQLGYWDLFVYKVLDSREK